MDCNQIFEEMIEQSCTLFEIGATYHLIDLEVKKKEPFHILIFY